MNKYSQISIAVLMTISLSAAPLSAFTPFDESSKIDINNNNKREQLETADIHVEETKSESKSTNKDSKTGGEKFPSKGKITASALNIRTSPWGDIIDVFSNGEEVELIGKVGDWYKVNYNGQVCYIHGNWVTTSEKQGQTAPKYGVVANNYGINIHRTPSGDVLTRFNDGDQVYILGEVGDWYKIELNGNEAFVSKKYIELQNTKSDADKNSNVVSQSFTGYVTASALNVRSGPWGNIDDVIYNGDQVNVIGKDGEWFLIEYNGETKYVHTDFISQSEPSSPPAISSSDNSEVVSDNAVPANNGSLQQNIVEQARALIGSTEFRTADVDYGNVACAKVVSTALNNAGAISEDEMSLDCYVLRDNLKAKGWQEVSPPPYQEGDVVFWSTYDWDGDGVIDEDTHVGVIVKEGNTYQAIDNSSGAAMPVLRDIDAYDREVSRVLRLN